MEVASHTEGYEGRLSDFVRAAQDTVRRRWLVLVLVSGALFAAGVAGILSLSPRYTAQALVRIDPSRNPLANPQQRTETELNPESLETEVAVLSSLDLAREVVRRERLLADPLLAPAGNPAFAAATPDEKMTAVAQRLLGGLSVSRDKLTYIIAVRYTTGAAARAGRFANAFADAYIDTKVNSKVGTAERQSAWFQRQLEQLGNEVRIADAQVAGYRARFGLVAGMDGAGGATIADQQVAPLSGQLATADSEAAAARASLNAAQEQVARGGLDSVAEVRTSPVVGELRRQRAEIVRSMGEVEARYGPRHPESLRVRDQLAQIDQQIGEEANRAMASLRASAVAAQARAGSLRQALNGLEASRARNTEASVKADSLQREAAAKRAAYERMSQLSLESTQAARNQISQAVIVERAIAPGAPSFPNKPLLIALALVLSVAAGLATIIVQEMLVQGMRTVNDVETTLGLPVLTAIPKLSGGSNPSRVLLEKDTSLFAEALRIARGAIMGIRGGGEPPKVIAITSALPGEGKTTTALSFARTLAMNGSRTMLVECDVRRAQIRTLVDTPPDGPGLVELLHGHADLADTINPGDVAGLDQILVKAPYFSSEDLFGSDTFARLLQDLRGRYDAVVLDLPPLIGLADGRYLAVQADAVVVIVRWASTPPQAALSAVNWLRSDGAKPVGVIYTMVDSNAEAIGGLYYSKKYSAYYKQSA